MAALSYYSNWEALQHLNSDMSILPPSELPPELLGCMSDDNFAFPDVCSNNIDYLFEPNNSFYLDENYINSQLPNYLSSTTGLITTPSHHNLAAISSDQPFLLQQEFDLEPLHYPKRQKSGSNYQEFNNYYSDNYQFNPVPNPVLMSFPDYSALPDFQSAPPVNSNGSCESSKKPSLSAQSIAARQRRRKLTEKTQELGKLIPGSQRMNTAEMFHAAYKYIKFLQSQVGILEFMGSYHQENEEIFESDELCGLLESPLVQEKLYSNEKCIVPKKLVEELSSDEEMFKAKPNVLEDIRQLVPTEEQYADPTFN